MLGDTIGFCTISNAPGERTKTWFLKSPIAGKTLPVIGRNSLGDCLCMIEGRELVDVDHVDVVKYVEARKLFTRRSTHELR